MTDYPAEALDAAAAGRDLKVALEVAGTTVDQAALLESFKRQNPCCPSVMTQGGMVYVVGDTECLKGIAGCMSNNNVNHHLAGEGLNFSSSDVTTIITAHNKYTQSTRQVPHAI
jgi:FKBP-type peptidyl-prolyl cis-trans isomerase 2